MEVVAKPKMPQSGTVHNIMGTGNAELDGGVRDTGIFGGNGFDRPGFFG